ncbi:hypothetical protein C8R30_1539 [Nitrosomonas nitrosa]|nr:hypothetical protein C8R30_1539 [Nitrosomonas nitrosa]
MSDLKRRITRLEAGQMDPVNERFYTIVCQFADIQNRPRPEKQPDITATLKQLAGYLPL